VNRKFREADYEITIHPNGQQKGVKTIILDGQKVDGTVIPYSPGKHTVEVTM
jgi:cellobiose phosphorylase